MSETRHRKLKNAPVANTPEGFWCCPSPTLFQKSSPANNKPKPHHNKPSNNATTDSNSIVIDAPFRRSSSRSNPTNGGHMEPKKRVSSNDANLHKDTLFQVLDSVLNSKHERGRTEMKSVVLKLLRENNTFNASSDLCSETINVAYETSLDSLLSLFRRAAQSNFCNIDIGVREQVAKSIALEADNLVWLLDILANVQAADEFVTKWVGQQELANLHGGLTIIIRYHASIVSARIFVLIGRGEILTSANTRNSLLRTWLQPLIDDYNWLQQAGCRSFDRDVVEEGICRTILTLPLEDQKTILLGWLGCFLKTGDQCPNLKHAFEVWWRRMFVRPSFNEGKLRQFEIDCN